jgi:hypothetical protein
MFVFFFVFFFILANSFTFVPRGYANDDPPVETRYMRGDQQTVNGLSAYILGTTQSDIAGLYTYTDELMTVYWGIRVWKRAINGTENEISAGMPVAQVSRTVPGAGLQNSNWACPKTSLVSSDAIVIRVYFKWNGSEWEQIEEFITEQLGAQSLNVATWLLYYYTEIALKNDILYYFHFRWGTNTYNSRITNFARTLIIVSILPFNISKAKGNTFEANVTVVQNVTDLYSFEAHISYRNTLIALNSVKYAWFVNITQTTKSLNFSHTLLIISGGLRGDVSGKSGTGTLARMNFTVINNGTTILHFESMTLSNSTGDSITCTTSDATVTVSGTTQYLLYVNAPVYGTLNITSGIHIYNNAFIIKIKATPTTGSFQCFTLDGVQYITNPISISMTNDHQISATFKIPILTVHTSEPSVTVYFASKKYTTNSSGIVLIQKAMGIYQLVASKTDFYTYKESVNLTLDKTINIQMYQVKYSIDITEGYQTCVFSGTIYYGNQYIDSESLIEVSSQTTTGTIKLTMHYNTNYPIIEIESQNVSKIHFDLAELYLKYCSVSYENMLRTTQFTGLKIDSNIEITVEIEMPSPSDFWKYPQKIWKMLPNGTNEIPFSDWSYTNHLVTLTLEPGDPTLSMLFPSPVNTSILVMFQVVLPIIALVGFAMVFIKERPKNIEDFVIYTVAFLLIGVVMPIAINLMVNG